MYSSVAPSTFSLLCNHHHHASPELSHLPKLKLCPQETLNPHPLLSSGHVSVYLTSPVPHISAIIHDSSFGLWLIALSMMFSRFIHVIASVGISFLLRLNSISLYEYNTFRLSTHPMIHICVVSTFWLLWIVLLWTLVYKEPTVF